MVDEFRQPELLGDRHELIRIHYRPIRQPQAQEALKIFGIVIPRCHDGLERDHHAAIVECADDLVRNGDVPPPFGFFPRGWVVAAKVISSTRPGLVHRFQRTANRGMRRPRVVGQLHRADAQRYHDGTSARRDDIVLDASDHPPRHGFNIGAVAIVQDNPKFVRREPAQGIAPPDGRGEALAGNRDHLVADVVAISLIDARQVVDDGQQKGPLGIPAAPVGQEARQILGQLGAVHHPGLIAGCAQTGLADGPPAIADHPDRSLRANRPAGRIGEANAVILNPDGLPSTPPFGQKPVAQRIRERGVGRGLGTAGHAVIPRGSMLRIDMEREGAATAQRGDIDPAEHGARVLRPIDPVRGEIPAIGRGPDAVEHVVEPDRRMLARGTAGRTGCVWIFGLRHWPSLERNTPALARFLLFRKVSPQGLKSRKSGVAERSLQGRNRRSGRPRGRFSPALVSRTLPGRNNGEYRSNTQKRSGVRTPEP